jgi:hypothetical protein
VFGRVIADRRVVTCASAQVAQRFAQRNDQQINRSVARFLFIVSPYGRVLRLVDAQAPTRKLVRVMWC